MESDRRMFAWLVEHNIPVLVIATKSDKIGRNTRRVRIAEIQRSLGVPELTVLPYASPKNEGRSELLDVMKEYLIE
jgi:probable GTP-binding protein engB